MGYTGLPAAKTLEQAILLAQLLILRKMEKTGNQKASALDGETRIASP